MNDIDVNDIDELVRRNGAALRDDVARTVDLEASLAQLRVRRHRERRNLWVVVVASAAAVAAIIGVVAANRDPGTTDAPTSRHHYVPCHHDWASVRCLPHRGFRIDATQPYTLHLLHGLSRMLEPSDTGTGLDVYRTHVDEPAGVWFSDSEVVAARRTGEHLSARQFADWVASRPYLVPRAGVDSKEPISTTVDGRRAWQVQVTTHHEPRSSTASCNHSQPSCWPLLATPRTGSPPWETGPWQDMATRYTFVELPGGKTFVIWSWAFGENWSAIDANDDLIKTLHFVRR
jgi:hypothetical protein